MRHVSPTSEILHKWAHQTQSDACNPQGNLYFRGTTLYSYRDNYPIAKIFKKKTGAALVLHVSDTYSNTTAGHCNAARRATSHLPCATVPDVEPDMYAGRAAEKHAFNVKFLVDLAAEHLAKAQRALSVGAVSWRRNNAREALQDAETYSRFFGIRRKVPVFPEQAWADADARAERIENPDPVRDARKASRELAKVYLQYQCARTAWRLGESLPHLPYRRRRQNCIDASRPIMLRVNGEEIETSQGARIPAHHAARLWKAIEFVRASGAPYERNGHSIRAGNYHVDRIEVDGTLRAGCHVIPHSELRSMARQLNFTGGTA